MTVAARTARLNAAVQRHWGESVTFIDGAGAETVCQCVLRAASDAIDLAGVFAVTEKRWMADINTADLATRPAAGDQVVTAAGVTYRVDDLADEIDGMWRLHLVAT